MNNNITKDSLFLEAEVETPCYVYDQEQIEMVLHWLANIADKTGCIPLYSIKSASLSGLLQLIQPRVAGFACSSLNEICLAREFLNAGKTTHVTTPGYRDAEWITLTKLADYVTLNSLTQYNYFKARMAHASFGLRVNPQLSFVNDVRYDPCRQYSKLGIDLQSLATWFKKKTLSCLDINGLHIHNNCESLDFSELLITVKTLINNLQLGRGSLRWVNLGGGYLVSVNRFSQPLQQAIELLQSHYDADVYLEPGKAVTGEAGYLISTVIDVFESDGKQVAVLDTSINHLPEVFEYQYQPLVLNSHAHGPYAYRLVGCSCLSGDLFGDYRFSSPLEIGSRIVFSNVGAYMQVKANMFNGINLPSSYLFSTSGRMDLLKSHDYESFRSRL